MHIILDFDGTITVDDTIGSLGAAAVSFQQNKKRQTADNDDDDDNNDNDQDWPARWQNIVADYMADHARHTASYTPAEADRTTLAHELAFLRSLRAVDGGSIRALHEAGLFRGMGPQHLSEASRKAMQASENSKKSDDGVRVRKGFAQFLADTATRRQWPVSVVSVNWSDAWIRGVLAAVGSNHDDYDHNVVRILSNEIRDSGAIASNFARASDDDDDDNDNDDRRPVSSCADKLEALGVAVDDNEPVVYMGDSLTDIECLVHAAQGHQGGGGIVLADGDGPATSQLLRAFARLGYDVPHVSEAGPGRFGAGPGQDSNFDEPRLAWARDFDEIMASGILGG